MTELEKIEEIKKAISQKKKEIKKKIESADLFTKLVFDMDFSEQRGDYSSLSYAEDNYKDLEMFMGLTEETAEGEEVVDDVEQARSDKEYELYALQIIEDKVNALCKEYKGEPSKSVSGKGGLGD